MKLFTPERVFFEAAAMKYPLGRELYERFKSEGIEIIEGSSRNISASIPGTTERQRYARSRKTLVVAAKKGLKLEVCKPSADFQFSLVTNCPGSCEYCYLQTTQGSRPYLRTYVNLEDIFDSIESHISGSPEKPTTFEAASSGDPLALEHLTGSLSRTVEFFGDKDNARLRVVTKFDNVEPFLGLRHNGHTRFRVSLNTRYVINNFEHNTANFEERLAAASKLAGAGYPIGFIIAPIMLYDGWQSEYAELLSRLRQSIPAATNGPVTFELIQHRFTPTAKKYILERFPETKLDMDEGLRQLKWGKFGQFKYVYPKEPAGEIKKFISEHIYEMFPDAVIEYFT